MKNAKYYIFSDIFQIFQELIGKISKNDPSNYFTFRSRTDKDMEERPS